MYVCLHAATLSHGIGTIMYVCVHFLLYWKLLSPSQIPHWKKIKKNCQTKNMVKWLADTAAKQNP